MDKTLEEKKKELVAKALKQITFRNNMSDTQDLSAILFDYCDEGVLIIKQWRKLKDDNEIINGSHDVGLIRYIVDKHLSQGREYYETFSSGGILAKSKQSPESRLKSTCKQVM